MSDSLWPHGLQQATLPCPSPSPGACSNTCPLSQWCHPTISSCHPLLLLPSIFPSIRVFSNESVLCRWPKCWSFSFSLSLSNEYSGLISFRTDSHIICWLLYWMWKTERLSGQRMVVSLSVFSPCDWVVDWELPLASLRRIMREYILYTDSLEKDQNLNYSIYWVHIYTIIKVKNFKSGLSVFRLCNVIFFKGVQCIRILKHYIVHL